MNIPHVTNKQNQIIPLLYKFRFLTVSHLQILLCHKDPRRIKEWLKDLLDKKYIARLKLNDDITQPYIYCLAQRAKYLLTANEAYDEAFLNRLYKEKNLTKNFIIHLLSLVDIYLFFLSQKEKTTKLNFYTKHELKEYDYFPEELPDAYIAVQEKEETTRYFLDVFDEYTPLWAIRKRLKKYMQYYENNIWQENTENSPFPIILIVLPHERVRKHIFCFAKALLEKNFYDDISFFLTTKGKIRENGKNIWEKIE